MKPIKPPSTPVRDSARPRAGRRFQPTEELELEDDARRAAEALPGVHRGLTLVRETVGPFGIPDLLAVVGEPERAVSRLALAVPPLLNEVDAGIVAAAAPRASRSPAVLAARLGWPESTVRRRLPDLLRSGAVIRTGADAYIRAEPLVPVGRLYAIETKVRDWRRALRQARTYGLWCDSYVIVMGAMSAASIESAASHVSADRGGLMVQGRWIVRPRIRQRTAAQRLWGSEHFVAALDRPDTQVLS